MAASDNGGFVRPLHQTSEPELQRSSCELKTSIRGADVTVKAYIGSPLGPACDEAMREYFRVLDRVSDEMAARRASA